MSVFPNEDHLASWAGVCPGNNESAGKHFRGKTRKGNPLLGTRPNAGTLRSTNAIPSSAPVTTRSSPDATPNAPSSP